MYKILIVDDDKDLLAGQKLFLEEKGYRVETALSMKDGLAKLENYKPDLILVDLMMEHYDTGFVFCKKIKDDSQMSHVPIIMQTGASREIGFTFNTTNPGAREWMKVDEILTKPVALDNLLGKIEQYLSKKIS